MKLIQNFRSHPSILKFPNDHFYDSELQPCGDPTTINAFLNHPILVNKKFPIVFHAIAGKDDREANSPSFFNIDEATQVKTYIQMLRSDRKVRISDKDIVSNSSNPIFRMTINGFNRRSLHRTMLNVLKSETFYETSPMMSKSAASRNYKAKNAK